MRQRSTLQSPAGRRRALSLGFVALLGGSACSGSVTTEEPPGGSGRPADEQPAAVIAAAPAPSSRFARLTHAQWENSVRDLLRLDAPSGLSSTFPADARTAGFLFDNHQLSLEVDQVLGSAYASAAEALAQRVTTDPVALARLLPPDTGDERERARAFIEGFGERAFRRALEPDEVSFFSTLFQLGRNAYDDASGFVAGVRFLIETFLRSPFFLYRIESSTGAVGATIPLSDYEIAQRLSYLFTNSMPDDALLEAARSGALASPQGVRRQAARLLATPGAGEAVLRFHDQLLDFAKYQNISPSRSAFPDVPPDFADDVIAASELFIKDLVFAEGGTFKDLMTSNHAFVNEDLAHVYGVEGDFGDELVKVSLPENERRGIFSQLGFLAANSTSVNPDPIHRGVFIATRALCIQISAPPDGVPPLPPITGGTNREIVANHTESSPVCRACHANLINPFGFPFENYDASGAFRTTDNGEPVDASTAPMLDGEAREIRDAVELAEALGDSPQAHRCFASHLVEYAFGRERERADNDLVDALTDASLSGVSIAELLLRIAESPAFLTRSAEELP